MSTSGDTPLTYRSAGVDIDAAEDSKNRLAKLVQSTMTAGARGAWARRSLERRSCARRSWAQGNAT